MIQSSKLFSILLFVLVCCLFNCQGESKVFVGEWQDSREPGNIWSISKSGFTFTGKRISGEDMYEYESEEWSFEIGEGGFPTLIPKSEKGGSTLIFQAKQNRILRSPPGRAYTKVIKK